MGYIVKKMSNEMPCGFFGCYIFLSAYLAILSRNHCITIQTVFFRSFPEMRQSVKF